MSDVSNSLGSHIPIIYHFAMLQDKQRMEGFREAISLAVNEGAKVLELGGGTGVLSSFAARKASKVYCVERIPENAETARKLQDLNPNGDRVEVICADALEYLPPEPIDVVICEMLHVGMLREKQIEVIESFKRRYLARFGGRLPRFVPEAFVQGIQLLSYNFDFFGFQAPVPLFQLPGTGAENCRELGDPAVYQIASYKDDLSLNIRWSGTLKAKESGQLNAVRVILKNVLTIIPRENRAVSWHNQYLVIPINQSINVTAGEEIRLTLDYQAGGEISNFAETLKVSRIDSAGLRSSIEMIRDSETSQAKACAPQEKIEDRI